MARPVAVAGGLGPSRTGQGQALGPAAEAAPCCSLAQLLTGPSATPSSRGPSRVTLMFSWGLLYQCDPLGLSGP